MSTSFTGACLCGAVRYECSTQPLMTGNCHCRDCQKAGGGAFSSALVVPAASLKITGEVKYYDTQGDSGQLVGRGFCPNCGARLIRKPKAKPDLAIIVAGSLDDPSWCRPTCDIYTDSAQPWALMNPELPKFSHMPPQ